MKTKHTPGPWEMHEGIDYIVVMSHDQTSDSALARVDTVANARLIAAAPELLAACNEVLNAWDNGQLLDPQDAAKLCAAIAKAEGAK